MFEKRVPRFVREHKLQYSFLLCTSILRAAEHIEPKEERVPKGTPLTYLRRPSPENEDSVALRERLAQRLLPRARAPGRALRVLGMMAAAPANTRAWAEERVPVPGGPARRDGGAREPVREVALVKVFAEEKAVTAAQRTCGLPSWAKPPAPP